MTDPAPAFIQPPDYEGSIEAASALNALIRTLGSRMPDQVYNAVAPRGTAGADAERLEASCEALYDWACNAEACPDEARRVAHGVCYHMDLYSFLNFGKSMDGKTSSRAALIRLELRRQLGDPSLSASEDQRPAPLGQYVQPPPQPQVTATAADIAALMTKLVSVTDGLEGGHLTKPDAVKRLREIHADGEGMTSTPEAADPAAPALA